ncbi:MAG: threonine-phosphate decarboxylase CobD [Butyricicoccus porcorum]|nr:threonine-phosphate decarboxylase CobD [Butyricicoccus porcorum]MDD6986091.1 threonine-phosphate decarboxylase CobD [Butyricicoccus porcorum]MDY4484357.1 threonine-phosphate decarboxylase CobD [Butyricicoccus porcorum]
MTENRHGGDIYAEDLMGEPLDFSASINPLGMPEGILCAAQEALARSGHYPDPLCRRLRAAIAAREGVTVEQVFCGGGAADVLFRLLLALKPKKILLPAPTFGEYAQAAALAGSELVRVPLREQDNFDLREDFWDALIPDIDAVIVCNPNNPTGRVIPKWLVKKGMERCAAVGATLIVDECFHDFPDEPEKIVMTDCVPEHRNLVLLRSFTKMYAMPGIRVGYCLSSDTGLLDRMYDAGAPWSVSVVAQECGIRAAQDTEYPVRTREYIAKQRAQLEDGLRGLGFSVIPGAANFVLFRNDIIENLAARLRARGILIRSCANFEGLDARWFRVAVRTEAENFVLLHALRELKDSVSEKKEGADQWQR